MNSCLLGAPRSTVTVIGSCRDRSPAEPAGVVDAASESASAATVKNLETKNLEIMSFSLPLKFHGDDSIANAN